MIESFADPETQILFETGRSRRLPPDILKRAVMRLTQLHAAVDVADLRTPPSNRLFEQGHAHDVEVVDYH